MMEKDILSLKVSCKRGRKPHGRIINLHGVDPHKLYGGRFSREISQHTARGQP